MICSPPKSMATLLKSKALYLRQPGITVVQLCLCAKLMERRVIGDQGGRKLLGAGKQETVSNNFRRLLCCESLGGSAKSSGSTFRVRCGTAAGGTGTGADAAL